MTPTRITQVLLNIDTFRAYMRANSAPKPDKLWQLEQDLQQLLNAEMLNNRPRRSFITKLHARYATLRTQRERKSLMTQVKEMRA